MDAFKRRSYLANQIFVISGVLSTLLSCGLGLGYIAVALRHTVLDDENIKTDEKTLRIIEVAGEIAFVPPVVAIPFVMQKYGRRIASISISIPLIFSWIISFDTQHYVSLMIFNILHHVSLGGTVAVSSVVISEFCSPKYRSTFLMLETAMMSLGVLISHVTGIFLCWKFTSTLGVLTAVYSMIITYFWPESPYWLMSQGHMIKSTESFQWLRGQDDEAYKELEAMLKTQKLKLQLDALRPVRRPDVKERIMDYLKSLLKADFLKPLSIMILLFSFVGFGGENVVSKYSLRDLFTLANGKYIGTIVVDILSLVCSLTACVLIQIVKRKTLFIFTGSLSIIFLAFTSLLLFLQSVQSISADHMWIFLSLVTGFVMLMSLGTTALPFSLLGELFPMSYRGIGSSLTCAYLWAFGNSILRLVPSLTNALGVHGILIMTLILMIIILIVLNKILPETSNKTLLEIEQLMRAKDKNGTDYDIVEDTEREETEHFERLKLFIDV